MRNSSAYARFFLAAGTFVEAQPSGKISLVGILLPAAASKPICNHSSKGYRNEATSRVKMSSSSINMPIPPTVLARADKVIK
jgi:hypothetical protein